MPVNCIVGLVGLNIEPRSQPHGVVCFVSFDGNYRNSTMKNKSSHHQSENTFKVNTCEARQVAYS